MLDLAFPISLLCSVVVYACGRCSGYVGVFVFLYFATFATVAIIFAVTGLDSTTAFSAAGAAVGNIGPGLGPVIGPAGSYASLDDLQKLVFAFTMVLGRLEILSVLVLLAPSFYR